MKLERSHPSAPQTAGPTPRKGEGTRSPASPHGGRTQGLPVQLRGLSLRFGNRHTLALLQRWEKGLSGLSFRVLAREAAVPTAEGAGAEAVERAGMLAVLRGPQPSQLPSPALEAEAALAALAQQMPTFAPWPTLTAEQRQTILTLLHSAGRLQAPQVLWGFLRSALPLGSVIQVECTTSLGKVDGQQVAYGGANGALTLTYVLRRAACAAAAPQTHWQLHHAGEIRAIIQINPSVLRGNPDEVVARLHTTLMHEYRHVEQQRARGFRSGLTFVVVGAREFLSERGIPQQERRRIAALDEIDATCAEIENAERTGLASSFELRSTVCYLWNQYEAYYGAVAGHPDPPVASRVYSAIQRGRHWLQQYMASPKGAWIAVSARAALLAACPLGYEATKIEPFVQR